jgi:hypothetical protein
VHVPGFAPYHLLRTQRRTHTSSARPGLP